MQHRLNVTYRIEWEGNWHVGSGFRTTATDRLVQRLGGPGKQPFVPGSQIKGVLRHACERLVQALGLDAVDPHASSPEQQRLLVRHFVPLSASDLIVDRLFGSRFQGDCLFVDSAIPSAVGDNATANGAEEEGALQRPDSFDPAGVRTTVRARTAIDRVTGTVRERHLFTTEAAEAGCSLTGRIRARHSQNVLTRDDNGFPYEYSLLIAGLLSVESLGGDKSSGLGRCRITIERVRWNGEDIELDDCLQPLGEIAEFEPAEVADELRRMRAEGR